MGDPKKIRKKYETPSHPWIKARIDEERRLAREFGTRTKKEIWKADTVLKNFKQQAKKLIALTTKQADVEKQHLFRRVKDLGLSKGQEVSFDMILGISLDDVMSRRLQSIVYKKGLAHSVKQARQFITHEHIVVDGKKITSPAYLVSLKEEAGVGFAISSPLYDANHPERVKPEESASEKASEIEKKEVKKSKAVKAEAKADVTEEDELLIEEPALDDE